jgi:ABC-type phosphate/phosphonate transport system ATPase subunit
VSEIRLEQVSKVFAGDVKAVDEVTLTIASG